MVEEPRQSRIKWLPKTLSPYRISAIVGRFSLPSYSQCTLVGILYGDCMYADRGVRCPAAQKLHRDHQFSPEKLRGSCPLSAIRYRIMCIATYKNSSNALENTDFAAGCWCWRIRATRSRLKTIALKALADEFAPLVNF